MGWVVYYLGAAVKRTACDSLEVQVSVILRRWLAIMVFIQVLAATGRLPSPPIVFSVSAVEQLKWGRCA